MICKIADLITAVPDAGDLVPRCQEYLYAGDNTVDIELNIEDFRLALWNDFTPEFAIYAESGVQFHFKALQFDCLTMHASAVELDGRVYLFSAPSGTGKTTHTKMWNKLFGDKAHIINDDKPVLRHINGQWIAYGSPWSGHGENMNLKAPLAGICFLKQAQDNRIRRLSEQEAIQKIVWQTQRRFKKLESLDLMLSHVGKIVQQIPVFELENRPEPAAVRLSYETMRHAAEEMGL